ncbi:hypothetical protein ACQPZF_10395 [Actinosynnema sp. CS-041913]|uniref:hypothetical protein n=1 Tax=Actinosynnema sp. CS-041913 TaxID=3239917 RepID=UPI003D8CFE6F
MPRIILRFRPTTLASLDLAAVQERAARLSRWQAEVVDTRLFDATFLSAVLTIATIDDAAVAELRAAFTDLPGTQAYVLRAIGDEHPLDQAGQQLLDTAGRAFPA